ncbi:hypothetical protein [Streptomyces sp. NPDC001536]|uniref:hypothetical protein n=1 Tax=Streptomyces sp. NPDC001536 TaxID=3364583 RepID=UPI003694774A
MPSAADGGGDGADRSEVCRGLRGLGHLPRVDAGGTANLVLLGLSALATRLGWWAPRPKGLPGRGL